MRLTFSAGAVALLGFLAATVGTTGAASETLASTSTGSTTSATPDCLTEGHCFTPHLFRVAYGVQPLVSHGVDGRGETMVLLEMPAPAGASAPARTDINQDMAKFDAVFGLPPVRLRVDTRLAAHVSSEASGAEEVEDAELVHAVAPGVAIRIILLNGTALFSSAYLMHDLTAALRLGVSEGAVSSLSGSWGEHCFSAPEVVSLNSALEAAKAHHVTVIASSGDYGAVSKPCPDTELMPVKEVGLPASDPLILSVGGTTLLANPSNGTYLGETG